MINLYRDAFRFIRTIAYGERFPSAAKATADNCNRSLYVN